jgi:hypothetical protein
MWIQSLIITCVIFILFAYSMIKTRVYLKEIYDTNFLIIYDFFSYFLLINILILGFIITYYHYKISIPGLKGPNGVRGNIGNQGKDSYCGVCEKRDNHFLPKDNPENLDNLMDTSNIDNFIKNNRIKEIKYKNSIKGLSNRWNAYTNLNSDFKHIGDTSMKCNGNTYYKKPENTFTSNTKTNSPGGMVKESCKDSGILQSNTFINGAILRIDPKTKDLYSLQYRNNKEEKKGKKYETKTEHLGGSFGKWGGQDMIIKYKDKKEKKEHIIKSSDRGAYYDFECPKNSGIYRIDTLHNSPGLESGGIKGIKFFCRDTKTGKDIKLDMPYGRNQNGAYFGHHPNIHNKNLIYKRAVCNKIKKNNKLIPSFISGVGAVHGQKINSLKIYNCSYRK